MGDGSFDAGGSGPGAGGEREDIRVVGKDNCVSFEGLKLQIPEDRVRLHYVKVNVQVHRYPDQRLAIFRGPRLLARYEADGRLTATVRPPQDCPSRKNRLSMGCQASLESLQTGDLMRRS